jgi:putative endopeptidase
MKGFYGKGEKELVTRLEAYVMISRAFGKLPRPTGQQLRMYYEEVHFKNIPGWAKEPVENLADARVIAPSEDHILACNDYICIREIKTIIWRIHRLVGKDAKKNFYQSSNKEWLNGPFDEA